VSYATERIILFDRNMQPLPEIPPQDVISRIRTEEINGEHKLVLTTFRQLEEGWRALTVDGSGKWREYVVTEIEDLHDSGKHSVHTYNLVWSLQYDLTHAYSHTHAEIGYGDMPKQSQQVAATILQDVPYWTVGPCDAAPVPSGKGAIFIYESAWSRLSKAVEVMECEVDAEIEVSNVFGVTARKLCLKAHLGNEEALRRFDWGHDLTSVKRTPDPGPYYCRVVPLGKKKDSKPEYADDDKTTFDWPLDITEETGTEQNPGPYWIQDDEAAAVFRRSDGNGGWIYPTVAVTYSDEDDPELLLAAAMEDLHNHTRPGVTYEADVVQLAQAGMDVHGVTLGDEVQVVDYGFNEDAGLRISGRVIKMEVDELSPRANTSITIGQLRDTLTDVVSAIGASFDELEAQNNRIYQSLAEMTTARYIDELLNRINTEINATGGYSYLVPGEGLITYNTAVSDPLVGSEAERVVQLKGGYLRIADSKKTPFAGIDDWDFKTILDSGHIVSDLVTAVKVTSGYIGNATNSNYWNLDTGELILRMFYNMATGAEGLTSGASILTKHGYVSVVDASFYDAITGSAWGGNTRYLPGLKISNRTAPTTANPLGDETSFIWLFPHGTDSQSAGSYGRDIIVSKHVLQIWSCYEDAYANRSMIEMGPKSIKVYPDASAAQWSSVYPVLTIGKDSVHMPGFTLSSTTTQFTAPAQFDSTATFNREVTIAQANSSSSGYARLTVGDIINTVDRNTIRIGPYLYVGSASDDLSTGSSNLTGSISAKSLNIGSNTTNNGQAYVNGSLTVRGGTLSCSGTVSTNIKSRLIETENYNDRLLFCYETPAPMFGDLGSSVLDEDGYAYVSIDDIFSETARTDYAYQVFLQKCGPGDLWVAEKHENYFVVQGTPNLAFDWELKAHQIGVENIRLDSFSQYEAPNVGMRENSDMVDNAAARHAGDIPNIEDVADEIESLYNDPIAELEQMYDDELAA